MRTALDGMWLMEGSENSDVRTRNFSPFFFSRGQQKTDEGRGRRTRAKKKKGKSVSKENVMKRRWEKIRAKNTIHEKDGDGIKLT